MDPARDLGAITDLIAAAFSSEMDERGRAALREMRVMSRLSPLVWWWAQADPAFIDTFGGFVWEATCPTSKRPQIVGNVSLNRAPGNRQQRIICNVVVKDNHRRQGIGRNLTEAAMAEAWELGAEGILIQVYQDNPPALKLYTDLGFQEAAGQMGLRLETIRPVPVPDAAGYELRAWRPKDGQAAHDLARLAMPSVLQWLTPVRRDEYRLGWWKRLEEGLEDLVTGRRIYRLVVLKHNHLAALLTVTAAFRKGDHRLRLLVHPDHTGQVEEALISRGLRMLAGAPSKHVRAKVDTGQRAVLHVLRRYGFEEQRTMLTLRLERRG
jgi:ribosomal protein S18 acetylase RimI-like enzyme